jgi:hypothetical protein
MRVQVSVLDGQIVNEFQEMLQIEKERGKESQGPNSSKNLLESEGDAKTRAAEKINADVSGERPASSGAGGCHQQE